MQWNLLIRTPSGPAVLSFVERGCPLSEMIFYRVCIHKSTFGLSRFVLFLTTAISVNSRVYIYLSVTY